jgi:hypothetical protein
VASAYSPSLSVAEQKKTRNFYSMTFFSMGSTVTPVCRSHSIARSI